MHASRASRNNSVFAGELGLIKKKISPFAEVHACKRQLLEKKGRKGGEHGGLGRCIREAPARRALLTTFHYVS